MKRLFKIVFYPALVLIAVLAIEVAVFHHILTAPGAVEKADLIVVFSGAEERIRKGYALAESGLAPYLVISPADAARRAALDRRYASGKGAFRHLREERARTTFQNALLTGRLIRAQEFKKCLLVTDDWHMPRALLLLRMVLFGQGVDIVPVPVAPGGFARDLLAWSGRQKKQVYNEMIEFWGSMTELIQYKVKGGLPPRSLKESETIAFLRSVLLFELD